MKKIIISAMIVLMVSVIEAGQALSKQGERFLVLGFASRQLNDVQDRLLRETVLYRLHTAGHAIVPVMEIEAQFQEETKRTIRNLSRADVRALCRELNAANACYGSIAPEDIRKKDEPEIMKGTNYICSLTIYRRSDDTFTETKFTVAGRNSLYEFFTDCAARIAGAIGSAAGGGGQVNPPRS